MEKFGKIKWTDKYRIGNVEINQERKELLATYNDFIDCVIENPNYKDFDDFLVEMIDLSKTHFEKEEDYLRKYSDESVEIHRVLHQSFLYEMDLYKIESSSGDSVEPFKVLNFIKTWWKNHTHSENFFSERIPVDVKKIESVFQ